MNIEQVNIDKMQFDIMHGCGTTNRIFILRQLTGEIFSKKREFVLCFLDLLCICHFAFDQVPRAFSGPSMILSGLSVKSFVIYQKPRGII